MSASTRRLPSTTIGRRGLRIWRTPTAPTDDATPEQHPAEDQAGDGSPRIHPHTHFHALCALPYSPLGRLVRNRLGGIFPQLPCQPLVSLRATCNASAPISVYPSMRCPMATRHDVARCSDVVESREISSASATIARPMRKPTSWARSDSGRPRERLDDVEQKVTAIEQRNRKQIEQPDRDRQHRGEMDQRHEARGRHLARHLGDADRAAELVGRFAAGDDAADIGRACARSRTMSLRTPSRTAGERIDRLNLRSSGAHRRLMPSTPMRCTLPKLSLTSFSAGVALRLSATAAALDDDVERSRRRCVLTMRCMSVKLSIVRPLIADDQVAGLEPGRRGSAAGCTVSTRARGGLLAVEA